jgi:hypothetical protein
MATSGRTTVKVTDYDNLIFVWVNTGRNEATNTSILSWQLTLESGSSGRISSSATKDWSVIINGVRYSGTNTVGIGNNETKVLAKGEYPVTHNADGSASIGYSFTQEFQITFSGVSIGNKTGTGTAILDTIPRASGVSCYSVCLIGNTNQIKLSKKVSGFNYTLTWAMNGRTGTIASNITTSPYNWVIPTSFYNYITNALEATCTINCATYSGSTLVGTKSTTFVCRMNANTAAIQPTLSPTVSEDRLELIELTGDSNKLIKYRSNALYSFGASAKYGAIIKSYKVTCGEKVKTGYPSGSISAIESNTFIFEITDSRGLTATKTITKTMLPYVPLTVVCEPKMTRSTTNYNVASISAITKGKGWIGTVNSSTSALNKIYVSFSLLDVATGNVTTSAITLNSASQYIDAEGFWHCNKVFSNLDSAKEYRLSVNVYDDVALALDDLEGAASAKDVYLSINPIFDWGKNDFNFNVPVTMQDNLDVAGTATIDYKIDFNGNSTEGAIYGLYGAPTIPSGADLNSYKTPGVYSINSNAIATSISNAPKVVQSGSTTTYNSCAGKLIVSASKGDYNTDGAWCNLTQEFIPYLANYPIYRRELSTNGTSGVWSYSIWYRESGNKLLWSGSNVMGDGTTITLTESIAAQPNGLILVFWIPSSSSSINTFYVSKDQINLLGAAYGHNFIMGINAGFSKMGAKYLYFGTNTIKGHSGNTLTGTNSGITFDNNSYALKYVIGV